MVSSIGDTRMPRRAMTARSYLMFWPTFSTAGSSSRGLRRSSAVDLSICVSGSRVSPWAGSRPKSKPPLSAASPLGSWSWVSGM